MQTITGLLLTAYVALLVAIWKQADVNLGVVNGLISFVPVALFVGSLTFLVVKAASYRGTDIVVGSLSSAVDAYEKAIAVRRSQLIVPGIFTLLGIPAAIGALLFLIQHE
jgi:hypothetical protein